MTMMLPAPLVYVGSTLSPDEVAQALPGCIVRPPVARGDLYRDRLLRGSVFLILDGVFFQQRAVSPREILDVIGDGALVIGAASMGALRAVECWPGGMRGVGSIYRLFRSGVLGSDDEVVVSFDPERPALKASVALVNVRYAVWRAMQRRRLDPAQAARVIAAAQSLFYAERHWTLICERAGGIDPKGGLARELASYDLKRLDALRALARLRRWGADGGQFFQRPRVGLSGFAGLDQPRERSHDALAEVHEASELRQFVLWLMASGRYRRHPIAPLAASGAAGFTKEPPSAKVLEHWFEQRGISGLDDAAAWLTRWSLDSKAVARAVRAQQQARRLLDDFWSREAEYTQRIMAALAVDSELEAELFRYRALVRLATRARALRLAPTELDRREAEARIALEHDFETWQQLAHVAFGNPAARELVETHCAELTLAYAMRRRMLGQAPSQ